MVCVDEWRRGLSVTNRKVKFCLLFSVWILSFVRTDVHVCGLDASKQLGDVFSMLIVACYIFYTLGKVFLQRQLFAVVPDIVADKS